MSDKAAEPFARATFAVAVVVLASLFGGLIAVQAVRGLVPGPILILSVVLGGWLAVAAAIDVVSFRLPDWTTLPLAGAGLLVAAIQMPDRLAEHGAAAAVGYGLVVAVAWIYRRLRDRDGIGGGDAKLLGAAGAWVGLDGLPSVLLTASVSALTVLAVARIFGSVPAADQRIPFGPFLAFGLLWVWVLGPLVG